MAHLLCSSSSLIHILCQKTPISTTSLESRFPPKRLFYRAPSNVLNQRLHGLRNKYGLINGYPLEPKLGDSCFQPLSCIHSFESRYRSWLQNQSSTALFSALTETVVNEGEEESWIDSFLPTWLGPYAHLARLDKPIGSWLLAWPFMWSITLAAPSGNLPDFRIMALIGVGSVFWRGAGCTINDFFDRDIDAKVQRTKSRPLACGMVTPFQALCFLGFQFLLGFGILRELNNYSCILGAPWPLLVSIYPLFKRFTYWPQAYLGFVWSWGAFLGWASIKSSIDLDVIFPLYISAVCWTLVYDTIYAHQDKEDDMKFGVKSTAILFGDQTKTWITGFSFASISGLILSGFNASVGWPFYLFMTTAVGHLAWQIITLDMSSPADCKKKFLSNNWFGAIVFIGILLGRLTT
ncbi:hypothetical protein SUGI_0393440 [Cryptomeria japonica]|uniref:4-hydroxybenzoate polyprenyltransferase, mitochondrial-like n=1 Tax=Cryptomeria japonica TaxID=3369 RepID=UPI002408E5B9|nr:4-hydroxybenzoate polyprenyltransferase, mitochondrial-like [Cryptomeria japonica]GLJ21378.1 hypothetical protein SUGI_0393440 [Cryptomeria japonica]